MFNFQSCHFAFGARPSRLSPDITSSTFWKNRVIYTAKVMGTGRAREGESPRQIRNISCQIEDIISGKPESNQITLPLEKIQFWTEEEIYFRGNIKKNDKLLIVEPNSPRESFVIRVMNSDSALELLNVLKTISSLKGRDASSKLMEHITSQSDVVVQYCLSKILNTPDDFSSSNDVKRVQAIADDQERNAAIRVMAYSVASKLAGYEFDVESEFMWLQSAIRSQSQNDPNITPFANRMLDLAGKRENAIKFMTELVLDSRAQIPTRVAICNSVSDARAFDYIQPDDSSELIFSSCLNVLDANPAPVRRVAGLAVQKIISRLNRDRRESYIRRAVIKLEGVLSAESDRHTRLSLERRLKRIQYLPDSGVRTQQRPA